MPTLLRRVLSYIRHAPDRVLHPRRRAEARRRLAGLGPIDSVLFICHGNICRSPYAAELFRSALPDEQERRVRIFSAGFVGPDRPSPDEAIAVASSRSLDLRAHRSRLLADTPERADAVVVMEPGQKPAVVEVGGYHPDRVFVLGDFDPDPIRKRTIFDPFGRRAEFFERSYDRIDRCMAVFLDAFPEPRRESAPPAGAGDAQRGAGPSSP